MYMHGYHDTAKKAAMEHEVFKEKERKGMEGNCVTEFGGLGAWPQEILEALRSYFRPFY